MNIFTKDDYRKIQAWLKANSIKDSDLTSVNDTIPEEDTLVLVQKINGILSNVKISIKNLLNSTLSKIIIDTIIANAIKVNNTLTVTASNVKIDNEKGTTLQDVLDYFEDNKLNRYTDDTFDGNLTVKKNITIEGNIKSHDDAITVEADLEATGEIIDGHGNLLNDVNSAAKQWSLEYQDPQQDEPTVRAKYVLKDYRGVPKGNVIKIYKDSAITNVYLGTIEDTCNPDTGEVTKHPIHDNNEALSIVYRLDTGKYSLVNVPIKMFATEAEFDKYRGLGITENGQVFVKLASDVESSNYLHFNDSGELSADGIENRILQDLGTIINSVANDGTMWGQYKKEEGTKNSPINESSRWGQYKQAEADRSELLNTVSSKVNQLEQEQIQGGVYDVSAHNNSEVFESLQALLSSTNLSTLIPTSVRRGGMSIRFIQGSEQSFDNKYVQYRYMKTITTTPTFNSISNWQGVDDEPIPGSNNLVKSGGVEDRARKIQEGNVKYPDNYITGYKLANDGTLVNDNGFCVTDFLDLQGYTSANFNRNTSEAGLICFYDSNKNLTNYYSINTYRRITDIPAIVKYIRMDFGVNADNPSIIYNSHNTIWSKETGESFNIISKVDELADKEDNNESNISETSIKTDRICDTLCNLYSSTYKEADGYYYKLNKILKIGKRYALKITTDTDGEYTILAGPIRVTSSMVDTIGTIQFKAGVEKIIFDYIPTGEWPYIRLSIQATATINVYEVFEPAFDNNTYNTRSKIYGIEIDNSIDENNVSRIADAIGLKNNYTINMTKVHQWDNDFDNIYPWCEMKLCNVKIVDGLKIVTYEGESGFSRNGSNGDVMVEIPKFYSMRRINGSKETICISGEKKAGFEVEPVFIDANGKELNFVYCGAYLTKVENSILTSKSGVMPTINHSLNMYRNCTGEMYDFAMLQCLQKLISIEFAAVNLSPIFGGLSFLPYDNNIFASETKTNANSAVFYCPRWSEPQYYEHPFKIDLLFVGEGISVSNRSGLTEFREITALGDVVEYTVEGVTYHRREVTFSGDAVDITAETTMLYGHSQKTGLCDGMNYHTGRKGLTNDTVVDQFIYRNIEGMWGNCGQMIDGLRLKQLEYYFTFDQSKYPNIANWNKLSYKSVEHHGYNWHYAIVKKMGYDRRFPNINLPDTLTGFTNKISYYGDILCAWKDKYNDNSDIPDWENKEWTCISSVAWDGGQNAGPYLYRFWQDANTAQWLYSTRMIYRSL